MCDRIDLKSYSNVAIKLLYIMGMQSSRTWNKIQCKNSHLNFFDFLFFLLICLDFQGVLYNEYTCVHLNQLVNFVASLQQEGACFAKFPAANNFIENFNN